MYSPKNGLVLGFHGCDQELRDRIVSKQELILKASDNSYDWLGNGIYFWENNYERAMDFAVFLSQNPPHNKKQKIKNPAVLGAIIDLGFCLDLLNNKFLEMLSTSYNILLFLVKKDGIKIPQNLPLRENGDLVKRYLDCAVIEQIHKLNKKYDEKSFDSVRGVFFEGEDLYPNAGFKSKNHIQIAIRNPNCIKGFFIPRDMDRNFLEV
ncbi:MAG: hypothetical protein AAGA77_10880 [Bacteroidota bacterium]